jgi:hypothetical protein
LVGMVARLDPMKDQAVPKAASMFIERQRNARFVRVGDGAERAERVASPDAVIRHQNASYG